MPFSARSRQQLGTDQGRLCCCRTPLFTKFKGRTRHTRHPGTQSLCLCPSCVFPFLQALCSMRNQTQPLPGARRAESRWHSSLSYSVKPQLGRALADHTTGASAVLAFQNLAPLLHTYAYSKEAQMREIKFSASIGSKNKVYKQLCQHNQKVHTALVFSSAESNS